MNTLTLLHQQAEQYLKQLSPDTLKLATDLLANLVQADKYKKPSEEITQQHKQHVFGSSKGLIKIADDFDAPANTQQILEMLSNIKPVKCKYLSEQIIQSLREGTPLS